MNLAMGSMLFPLLLLAGVILLQIFLSRRASRWPGLLLPGVTFFYSLVMLLSVAVYNGMGDNGMEGAVAALLSVLVLGNIPTVMLLIIYALCRGRERTQRELNKMNSQDLS